MATEHDLAFEGAKNTLKGKAREIAGVVTDNESQEAKGKSQALGGKLQTKAAKAIKDVKGAVRKI